MAVSPSASAAPSSRTWAGSSGPFWPTASDSDGPGMYAVTIHGGSASGSASTTAAVWKPPTCLAAAISRANRRRNSASSAYSGRMSLTATFRPPGDVPRNTCAMPPTPSLPSSR